MKKIPRHSIENYSYEFISHLPNIKVVKRNNYSIVEGLTISGDAPKVFLKLYDKSLNYRYDELSGQNIPLKFRKIHRRSWPLYIAKTGNKWYPQESITEHLLCRLGEDFGLMMAKTSLRIIGGQLRLLSKYFLNINDEELVHGADIFSGYIGDKEFIQQIEDEKLARDFFTLQFVDKAVEYSFEYQAEDIMRSFIKMLMFDALVGNNDRHFYNWGIKRSLSQRFQPYFSPIYDTARGLFWNDTDQKLNARYKVSAERKSYIKKYCKNSRPKIGWENEKNIDHFKLVLKIVENGFYVDSADIKNLFSDSVITKMFNTIDNEFVCIMSPIRINLIKETLEYRYNKLLDIIC